MESIKSIILQYTFTPVQIFEHSKSNFELLQWAFYCWKFDVCARIVKIVFEEGCLDIIKWLIIKHGTSRVLVTNTGFYTIGFHTVCSLENYNLLNWLRDNHENDMKFHQKFLQHQINLAIERNSLSLVIWICTNFIVDPKLSNCLAKTCRFGRYEITEFLLKNYQFSSQSLIYCLKMALVQNFANIANLIFQETDIHLSKIAILKLITETCEHNHIECLWWILQNLLHYSPRTKGKIISQCLEAAGNNKTGVQIICQHFGLDVQNISPITSENKFDILTRFTGPEVKIYREPEYEKTCKKWWYNNIDDVLHTMLPLLPSKDARNVLWDYLNKCAENLGESIVGCDGGCCKFKLTCNFGLHVFISDNTHYHLVDYNFYQNHENSKNCKSCIEFL